MHDGRGNIYTQFIYTLCKTMLFRTLQASASLCKHSKKEEACIKKTTSTYKWRVTKGLAIFEGA